jgi:hypothetical protein
MKRMALMKELAYVFLQFVFWPFQKASIASSSGKAIKP